MGRRKADRGGAGGDRRDERRRHGVHEQRVADPEVDDRAARPVCERRRADADAQGEARGGDEELRRGDRRDVRVAGEVRALRPERWRRLGPGGADELLMTATSARTADDAKHCRTRRKSNLWWEN